MCLVWSWCLPCWIAMQMMSATAFSTCSWHHLYLIFPKAFGQQLKMCSKEPLFKHSGHATVLARPKQCRLDGLGRTSFTDWIRNLSLAGSDFQSSAQVILQAVVWFQLVQAPCFCIATVLWQCPSSISAWISPWINWSLSLSPSHCCGKVLCSFKVQFVWLPQKLPGFCLNLASACSTASCSLLPSFNCDVCRGDTSVSCVSYEVAPFWLWWP